MKSIKIILVAFALTISAPALAKSDCGTFDYDCLNQTALSQIKALEEDYALSKKNVRHSLKLLHYRKVPQELRNDLITVENYIEEIDQILSQGRDEVNFKYRELKNARLFSGYRTHAALEEYIEALNTAIDGFDAINVHLQIAILRFESN